MRKDRFTDEALAAAKALAELKYSENPEDQVAFEEAYDFARCQRPDGSFYGTSGQCRKGKESGAKEAVAKAPRAPKAAPAPQTEKKPLGQRLKEGLKSTPLGQRLKKEMDESRDRREKARRLEEGKKALKEMSDRASGKPAKPAKPAPKAQGPKPDTVRAVRDLKAQDATLRSAAKDKIADQKTRKAELDRLDRAFKAQEKAVKAEPTRENKERLKKVRTALIQQDRFYNRGERELEKIGKARAALDKKIQRMQMSPAQRAEARRIDKIIKERG